jgi:hypothetical protein
MTADDNEDRETKVRVLRRYATDTLFKWLTDSDQEGQARSYIEKGAGLALGKKVRLVESSRLPEAAEPSMSDSIMGVTATRLAHSFGEDAADDMYPSGTWAGRAAFGLALFVDWHDLADQLLRRFVPEYVPSETRGVGDDDAD